MIASSTPKQQQQRQQQKVLVLGAGISGLACARELQQRGYHVLVIEARHRVGGRLKGADMETIADEQHAVTTTSTLPSYTTNTAITPQSPSVPLDLGGALIHGIIDNPVYSLVTQMGIPVHPLKDTLLLDTHGWPMDAARDEKVSTLFNDCLDETFRRIAAKTESTSNCGRGSGETPIPLSDTNSDNLLGNNEELRDGIDDSFGHLFQRVSREKNPSTENDPLWQWHRANLEVSCGASLDQLGYGWNEDEAYGFDGDHVALSTSWKAVTEGLADGLEILYGSPVTRVCRVDPVTSTQVQRKVSRTTLLSSPQQNGSKSALPTNLWRHKPSASSSARLRRSRRLVGESTTARRSARASKGQLTEARLNISSSNVWSYDDDSLHNKRKLLTRKRRSSSNDGKGAVPASRVQVTLHDGTVLEGDAVVCTLPLGILKVPLGTAGHVEFYPPLSQPKQKAIQRLGCGLLNKCVLSFSRIFWQDVDFMGMASATLRPYLIVNASKFATDNKPVLIFMFGGAFAREMEEWKDSDVVEDCMTVLRALCGRRGVVPDPLDYHVTRWGREVYSKMAFTYIPPGVNGMQELKRLSEPVYDPVQVNRPVLMFAGEHTTPYHPSTIHGAFLSGIREAYRLDLAIDSEANGNLLFLDNQLYQRTFSVRRKFRGSVQPNGVSSQLHSNSSSSTVIPKQRRRGAAGVMTLRRNPKTVLQQVPMQQNGVLNLASRRSQRSLSRKPWQADADHDADVRKKGHINGGTMTLIASTNHFQNAKVDLHALEDRSLLRGVESFGRDFAFIRSKVLPVHGGSRRKTTTQLRARYRQLVRTTPPLLQPNLFKGKWAAKETFELPVVLDSADTFRPEPELHHDARAPQSERRVSTCFVVVKMESGGVDC